MNTNQIMLWCCCACVSTKCDRKCDLCQLVDRVGGKAVGDYLQTDITDHVRRGLKLISALKIVDNRLVADDTMQEGDCALCVVKGRGMT